MRLEFTCKQSMDCQPYVNCAVFTFKDGCTVEVDRWETNWDWLDGILSMEWRGLYVWDQETESELPVPDNLPEAELSYLDVEDDVPAGYEIECLDWTAG